MALPTELDVLGIVSRRLDGLGIAYMLTGSFALAYYATPRMTRDLDVVVEVSEANLDALIAAFESDFYVDAEMAAQAVRDRRLFNLMHLVSGIKVDFVVRKDDDYRRLEFARRARVRLGDVETSIVSREDLVLSKLAWARASDSELQMRDVAALLAGGGLDEAYLSAWSGHLDVAALLERARNA